MRRAAFLLLLACAPAARTVPIEVPEAPPPPESEAAPPREPSLTRAELDSVLDAGPGRFLERVQVRAYRPGGRFVGWEIVGFGTPGEPLARVLGLGDVVQAVNGKPLERPEQFSVVWEQLRAADAVIVRLTRRGEGIELVFPVVGP